MNREEKNIIEAIRYDQFKANAEKKQNAMGYEQAITTLLPSSRYNEVC